MTNEKKRNNKTNRTNQLLDVSSYPIKAGLTIGIHQSFGLSANIVGPSNNRSLHPSPHFNVYLTVWKVEGSFDKQMRTSVHECHFVKTDVRN